MKRTTDDACLIFVHGVGAQIAGETAAMGADCLIAAVNGGSAGSGPTVAGMETQRVTWRTDGKHRSVLCLDGWWDDLMGEAAERQGVTRVWLWLVAILPTAVAGSSALAATPPEDSGWIRSAGTLFSAMQSVLWRTLIAGPLLLTTAIVGSIMLMCEALSGRLFGTRDRLATVVRSIGGDAWAFSRSESRDAVLKRLDEAATAAARHGRVVFVAHSQGGAISRSICGEKFGPRDLITIGSGSNLLAMTRATRGWRYALGWFTLLSYPFILEWGGRSAWRESQEVVRQARQWFTGLEGALQSKDLNEFSRFARVSSNDAGSLLGWTQGDTVTLVFALVVLSLAYANRGRPVPDEIGDPSGRWIDVSSIYDPVCVGARLEESAEQVAVVNSRRIRELPTEHTTYFSNAAVGSVLLAAIDERPVPADQTGGGFRSLRTFKYWGLPLLVVASVAVIRTAHWLVGA